MKKLLALIFGTVVAFSAMCQVPALNEIVKTNTLSPSRVGAALEAAEVYTASGTDTYTVSISVTGLYSGAATYASGDQFTIVFTNANATTTPTLNINSEGAVTIVDNKGDAVAAGDIEGALKLMYDGTNFRVIGGTGSGGGGGTVTDVNGTTNRITSTGGATPQIDISATFEALLGKVANRIDQNNASTTSAQLATTLSDESGTGTVVYSSYADAKVADAINNGTTTIAPSQNAVFDALALKKDIANTAGALTDGSSIDITGTKHTLTTDESTITFSQSYTGDYANIDVTFNTTAATWTFPAGSLCVVEGSASGNNTATLTGVSGDKIVVSIWFVSSGNYRVAIKNFGQ